MVHDGVDMLKEQARSQVGHLGEFMRERGEALLREQKDRLAEEITAVSRAIRSTADNLEDGDSGGIVPYVGSAADGVAQVARLVEKSDMVRLGHDMERFARRHPAAVLGGMFVLGLAAGRLARVGLGQAA
jgi:hypothetical protein